METSALLPFNVYDPSCPTRRVLDLIADKWTVLVIGFLSGGTRRFGEIGREVGGCRRRC